MPKKIKACDLNHLINVPLPTHGDTYTVISHKFVIDYSKTALENAGFKVVDELYRCTADGNIASGIYKLDYNEDPELSMMFAWTNSYNKQVRFKCGIGTYINKTGNFMVSKDMGLWTRKHTGKADEETENTIDEQVETALMYYNQLATDKDVMKEVPLDKRKMSQLLGVLFADFSILTTEQASIVRDLLSKSNNSFDEDTRWSLWAFYNYVTTALQQSHPKTWMEDQRILHYFIDSIVQFTKVETPQVEEKEEEFIDPNQVDLEDMIAEAEAENAADAEMQEMKTEEIIKEKIAEDEAAVAEVCDEPEDIKIHVESDEEYQKRVAEIEGEISDEEAAEIIKGQEAIDQQMAQEHAATQPEEDDTFTEDANFELDFADVNDTEEDEEDYDNVDFEF